MAGLRLSIGGSRHAAWVSGLALIGLGFVLGCGGPPGPGMMGGEPPTPTFTVAHPLVNPNSIDFDEYTGRTDAIESVEIRARVNGHLDKIHFVDSQIVHQGDLLFTIDPRPYVSEKNRAEGDVTRLKARRERLQADVERISSLIKSNAASRQEYDKTLGDRAEVEGELMAAQAALEHASLDLNFTEIRSPITGRISRRLITEGNLVSAGVGGSGTLLTTIVSLDPIYVYCDCSEANMLKYQTLSGNGSRKSARDFSIPMFIGLANEEGYPREGIIDFVDNRVDASTGTILARGLFKNEDEYLKPGMFVRVRVPGTGVYSALLVPERAIGTQQGQKFVFVVNNENKVEQRNVKLGLLKDSMRVIKEGVKEEDKIVIAAMARVRPGMKIDPKLIKLEKPAAFDNELKAIERMKSADISPAARVGTGETKVVDMPPAKEAEAKPEEAPAPKP